MVSAASDFVYAKFSEINVIIRLESSTFLLFLRSSVMILLSFLSFCVIATEFD